MDSCYICGEPAVGQGYVEGAKIALCNECSRHAKRFELFDAYKPLPPITKQKLKQTEPELVVGFGARIREAREKKGLNREGLGKKLLISEPDLRAFEEERRKPLPDVAKKLEYALGIKLLQVAEESHAPSKQPGHEGFTIGDVVKLNKR